MAREWRRGWDSNPRYACTHNGFRDRPDRPLRHPSAGSNGAASSPVSGGRTITKGSKGRKRGLPQPFTVFWLFGPLTPQRVRIVRNQRPAIQKRFPRISDPRSPAVRCRIARQVARLRPESEAAALDWIEAVSELDQAP